MIDPQILFVFRIAVFRRNMSDPKKSQSIFIGGVGKAITEMRDITIIKLSLTDGITAWKDQKIDIKDWRTKGEHILCFTTSRRYKFKKSYCKAWIPMKVL